MWGLRALSAPPPRLEEEEAEPSGHRDLVHASPPTPCGWWVHGPGWLPLPACVRKAALQMLSTDFGVRPGPPPGSATEQ